MRPTPGVRRSAAAARPAPTPQPPRPLLTDPRPRTLVMGVVNVTPDSFSDGGDHADVASAVAHGQALLAAGADLLDVGGESTRPGAGRVPEDDELRRVVPVVEQLVAAGAVVSVDTVARRSRRRRSGRRAAGERRQRRAGDDAMLALVARTRGRRTCVMHGRGPAPTCSRGRSTPTSSRRSSPSSACGSTRRAGPGCGRTSSSSTRASGSRRRPSTTGRCSRALPALDALGCPVLVGASRKAFLGALLAGPDGPARPRARDAATAAVTVLAAQAGAWAVRVHDVGPSADAVRVVAAVRTRRGAA